MPLGWTKPEVIKLLKSIEQPTPTDDAHPAHWWNKTFGLRIKNSFDIYMAGIIEQIARAKEE